MKAPTLARFLAPALAGTVATLLPAGPALAQSVAAAPVVAVGNSVLTVTAEGRSTRTPDLAVFSAGVTTQAPTASAALAENAARMNAVIAALRKAGIAERDVRTNTLSVSPVYGQPRADAEGAIERQPVIVAYQATNQVEVRQRKLAEYGRVIDTLVNAGANQVNGPDFRLDDPDAATDEARAAAMKTARARAELYARAAGLRVVRVLTISEAGGWQPPVPVMYARAEKMMAAAAPSPVAAGELDLSANVTVTYELAP